MKQQYQSILFLDIETVPGAQSYQLLGEREKDLFKKRFQKLLLEKSETHTGSEAEAMEEIYQNNAALHAEFAQIVSIGLGYLTSEDEMRVRAIVSEDEISILYELFNILNKNSVSGTAIFTRLAGHNSDNFDLPFLCRRMAINRIKIPMVLDPTGKKPWELSWIDTMKIFGYGEWNFKISLDRLCFALGIPSPKADMDGSQVKDLYYGATPGPSDLPFGKFDKKEARFEAIGKYQAGDIVALVNAYLRLNNDPIISEDKIKYV